MAFRTLIITASLLTSLLTFGQDNAVKLVLAPGNLIMANNVAFAYERKLNDRFSGSVKYNFSSKKNVPLKTPLSNYASNEMNSYPFNGELFDDEFISSGISLELRYYTKKTALSGLYISTSLAYQKTTVSSFNFFYLNPSDPNGSLGGSVDMGFNFFGGSVGIGNHWKFKDKIAIDILWAGLGLGRTNFRLSGTELPGVDINFPAVENNVAKFIDRQEGFKKTFLKNGVETSADAENISITSKNIVPYAKLLNVSIGLYF